MPTVAKTLNAPTRMESAPFTLTVEALVVGVDESEVARFGDEVDKVVARVPLEADLDGTGITIAAVGTTM